MRMPNPHWDVVLGFFKAGGADATEFGGLEGCADERLMPAEFSESGKPQYQGNHRIRETTESGHTQDHDIHLRSIWLDGGTCEWGISPDASGTESKHQVSDYE